MLDNGVSQTLIAISFVPFLSYLVLRLASGTPLSTTGFQTMGRHKLLAICIVTFISCLVVGLSFIALSKTLLAENYQYILTEKLPRQSRTILWETELQPEAIMRHQWLSLLTTLVYLPSQMRPRETLLREIVPESPKAIWCQ